MAAILPDDADPALVFVASLTPLQRAVLCQVGTATYLQLDHMTDQQRAIAAGLAASDMALLARAAGVEVVALHHEVRVCPSQGYVLTSLGIQVVAGLQEDA
jgi:hypothetical protein